MSKDTRMALPDKSTMISPRLNNGTAWSDPIRPDKFVRPIRSSNQRLVDASKNSEIDVHLHRPQTMFATDSKGTPDFNSKSEMTRRYQAPMKVNKTCELKFFSSTLLGSSCPTEQSISGSSYVNEINNADYLFGLHIKGDANSYESFSDRPNLSIPSSEFCKDYESVCGEPCAELDEVLPQ